MNRATSSSERWSSKPSWHAAPEIRLYALWFDLGQPMMHLYEADQRRFVPLDEAEVIRLLTPAADRALLGRG